MSPDRALARLLVELTAASVEGHQRKIRDLNTWTTAPGPVIYFIHRFAAIVTLEHREDDMKRAWDVLAPLDLGEALDPWRKRLAALLDEVEVVPPSPVDMALDRYRKSICGQGAIDGFAEGVATERARVAALSTGGAS